MKEQGKYSNPSAVIFLAVGEILARADSAVIDFNDKVVGELDDLLQEIAHFAHNCAKESRRIEGQHD